MRRTLPTFSSYLFCLTTLLDPTNSILGLKTPIFVFFIFSLLLYYKPQMKYWPILCPVFFLFIISFLCGTIVGIEFDYSMTIQHLLFFLLFISLLWDSKIDLFGPIVLSSLIVSIITIVGYIAMFRYPQIESILYAFSSLHNNTFLMSHRTFLGVSFVSFFYKSIPVVIIPASYYLDDIINNGNSSLKNIVITVVFLFSLFCAGNRTMIGIVFIIIFFISYNRISKWSLFKPLILAVLLCGVYVGVKSITEKGEESNDIKYAHIVSYIDFFSKNWYLMLFGTGAGSLFFSKGVGEMTGVTEWTYLEILRLYGVVGFFFIMLFFLYPLIHYYTKLNEISHWKAFSMGYIFYLIVCASNPYLISSTGFLCILLLFSVISNPRYKIIDQ